MPTDRLIEFKKVVKAFGPKQIYEDLSFDVRRGESLTVIGGSGTGKSVMLKLLIGLLKPDAGQILFDGEDVVPKTEDGMLPVRRRIGMLFQGAALFDSLSVAENVMYPLREHFPEWPDDKMRDRARECLGLVGLGETMEMKPADLSGGMKKRVGLARAIATQPEVILYDEPTTGLDPINVSRINRLIRDLQHRLQVTSIVVTHDMGSAFYVSDRMAMLFQKRILFQGTTDEFRQHPNREIQNFIQGTFDDHDLVGRSA
jgi:phospholipid/cholesterol/gamma-HCH transport system ATP-binding protein